MGTLGQDLRHALRTLRKHWMITALAILSLALAIGGNAAVFSMVDAFMFRPLPYPEPERMVLVGERQETTPANSGQFVTSLQTARDWSERSRTVARWASMQPRTLSLRGTERATAVSGVATTRSFFELLGASPVRGRLFTAEEEVEGGPDVALLGYDYWIDNYGPETDPLGEVLVLNGDPHEVIGVLPQGFGFLLPNQDVWIPIQQSTDATPRDQRSVLTLGRMHDGVDTEQVRAEMLALSEAMAAEFPETMRGWTVDTYNLRYDIPLQSSRILFGMLQGSVLLVLLIACVNITNLLLARGQERAREIALRTALGASRLRIVRQLLTESLVMVLVGAAVGLGLAWVGIEAISGQFTGLLPPNYAIQMDDRVLIFTVGLSVVAGLLFGVAPALQTFKSGQAETLKEGGGRGGSARSKKWVSKALVVGEIALSFVALGGGSLLVRSFLELQGADPGFEPGPVLTAVVRVPASKYPEDADQVRFQTDVLERTRSLAGVDAVAMVSSLPQQPFAAADSFRVDGAAVDQAAAPPQAIVVQASPEYLDVLDVALVRGRFFETADGIDAASVVAVSQRLAEVHFPDGAVGRNVTVRGESRSIVGVVENVQQVFVQTPGVDGGQTIYLPTGQVPDGVAVLAVRTRGNPGELAEPLRGALEVIDRDLTVTQILTMEEFVEQFFVGVQVFNVVLGGFGLIALLLASLGTYGVLAYSVSRRSHEIGIRMALGAEGRTVVRMIAKQGIWLGVIGLAIGALLTLPLVGVLRSVLQGLSTVQPSTLVLIGAVLFGVTVAASLLPAARAAAVDPIRTLRDE